METAAVLSVAHHRHGHRLFKLYRTAILATPHNLQTLHASSIITHSLYTLHHRPELLHGGSGGREATRAHGLYSDSCMHVPLTKPP